MLIGQGQEVLSSGATKNLLMVAAIATVLSTATERTLEEQQEGL